MRGSWKWMLHCQQSTERCVSQCLKTHKVRANWWRNSLRRRDSRLSAKNATSDQPYPSVEFASTVQNTQILALYTDASFNSHNSALATRQTGRGSRLQSTSPAKQLLQLPLRQTCFCTSSINSGINNVTSLLTTKLDRSLIGFTISADKLVALDMSLPQSARCNHGRICTCPAIMRCLMLCTYVRNSAIQLLCQIISPSLWGLWRTLWQRDRFLSECLSFPLLPPSPQCSRPRCSPVSIIPSLLP